MFRCGGMTLVTSLFCICVLAQTLELPLTYERYADGEQERRFLPYGYAHIGLQPEVPEGDWKLPELHSEHPLYGWLEIGDQKRLLVVDQRSRRSRFYDRIYLDLNADGDLTNGLVVNAQQSRHTGQTFNVTFPSLDIQAHVDGISLPYAFVPELYYWTLQPMSWGAWFRNVFRRGYVPEKPIHLGNLNLRIATHCMYTTELELNGDQYLLYLNDRNTNGRFDDWGTPVKQDERDGRIYTAGDRLYLTSADTRLTFYDEIPLGRYLNLKDVLYALDISLTDTQLTLTPVTDKAVKIELPVPVHRLSLISDDACVMALMPGESILAPPGTYRLVNYMLLYEEPAGAQWQMIAFGIWDAPVLEAAAGGAAAYAIGEPFRPTVVVPWWSRDARENVRLSLEVVGAAGEIISELRCIQNQEKSQVALTRAGMPEPPRFRIIKPDGEVAFQGRFEYG